jgi:hypothetical protein
VTGGGLVWTREETDTSEISGLDPTIQLSHTIIIPTFHRYFNIIHLFLLLLLPLLLRLFLLPLLPLLLLRLFLLPSSYTLISFSLLFSSIFYI